MPTTRATPAPFRRQPRDPNGLSSGGAPSDTLQMPRERFLVDARLAQDPADGIPTEGLVERDDEEVRPIGVDQLPVAAPLAFDDLSEPGRRGGTSGRQSRRGNAPFKGPPSRPWTVGV